MKTSSLKPVALALAMLILAGQSARADDDNDMDNDDILKGVQSGAILPLPDIREKLAGRIDGEIVRIRVMKEDGQLIYKVRILKVDGKLVEAEVDAATGTILEIENE